MIALRWSVILAVLRLIRNKCLFLLLFLLSGLLLRWKMD